MGCCASSTAAPDATPTDAKRKVFEQEAVQELPAAASPTAQLKTANPPPVYTATVVAQPVVYPEHVALQQATVGYQQATLDYPQEPIAAPGSLADKVEQIRAALGQPPAPIPEVVELALETLGLEEECEGLALPNKVEACRESLFGMRPITPAGRPALAPAGVASVWVSQNYAGRQWRVVDDDTVRIEEGFGSAFKVVSPGLTGDPGTVSFEDALRPGFFLRHCGFAMRCHTKARGGPFQPDATFRPRPALSGCDGFVSYESVNFPGMFISHRSFVLRIEHSEGSQLHREDASFASETPPANALVPPPKQTLRPAHPANGADYDLSGSDGGGFALSARICTTHAAGTIVGKPFGGGVWRDGGGAGQGKMLFLRDGRLCFDVGWVGCLQSAERVDDGRPHVVSVSVEPEGRAYVLSIDGREVARGLHPVADHPETSVVVGMGIGHSPPRYDMAPHYQGIEPISQVTYQRGTSSRAKSEGAPAPGVSSGMQMDESVNFIAGARYSQIELTGAAKNLPLPAIFEHAAALCEERGAFGCFYQQHHNGHEIIGFYASAADMQGERVKHGHRRGFVVAPGVSSGMQMDESVNFITGARYSQIELTGAAKNLPLPAIFEHAAALCEERGAFGCFYQQHHNGHEIIGFYASAADMQGERVKHGHRRGFVVAPSAMADEEAVAM